MWLLIWVQFMHNEFEYYHIGTYGSEENCKVELAKSKVLVTNANSTVECFKVERSGK